LVYAWLSYGPTCTDNMDIPSPPSIFVSKAHRYSGLTRRSPSSSSTGTSISTSASTGTAAPMSIPSAARNPSPPPPLPPPRNIEELGIAHEPAWTWPTNPPWTGFGKSASVKPGSSLLGQHGPPLEVGGMEERVQSIDYARRSTSTSTNTPAQPESSSMGAYTTFPDNGRGSGGSSSTNYRYVTLRLVCLCICHWCCHW